MSRGKHRSPMHATCIIQTVVGIHFFMETMVFLSFVFLSLAIVASPASTEEPTLRPQQQGKTASASAPRPVRLILSDIDGTLVGRDGVLPSANVDAFRLAHSLGIQVAVATGRPLASVLDLLGEQNVERMGFSGNPGIYLNGAYILGPSGEVLRDSPITHNTLKHILNVIEEEGLIDRAVGVTEGPLIRYQRDMWRSMLHSRAHKVHVEGEPVAVEAVLSRLKTELGDSIGFVQSHSGAFEVLQPGMDKGEALELLCAALGLSTEEVLVLGNALNDLPMFKVAGTAVAVGDGYTSAKEAANFVTVPSTKGALMQVLMDIKAGNLCPNSPTQEGSENADSPIEYLFANGRA